LAVTKVSARKWTFGVSTDGRGTWTTINGINKFSFGRSSSRTDTTDFTADGIETGEIMQRGASLKLEGFFLEDLATKARDAGQAAVETFAEVVGPASVGDFRLTSPGGKVYTFSGTVELGDYSGGNNDKTPWSATITRSGALTIT
jgi:hypothetical protein